MRQLYIDLLKVKLSLCLTNSALRHEDVWGSGDIDYIFLLRHYFEQVVSFTVGRYPLDRRLGRPQNRSGRSGVEKILPIPRLELRPLGRPAPSQSLYRLRYPGSHIPISTFPCYIRNGLELVNPLIWILLMFTKVTQRNLPRHLGFETKESLR
jgi:hypothetical protein